MIQNYINKFTTEYNNQNLEDYSYIHNFKKQKLENRIQTTDKILLKYTGRVPIIIDSKKDIKIEQNRYIVPTDLSVGQFLFLLKKKILLSPVQSIFLICNNTILMNTDTILSIYSKHKDYDGFLYIYILLENTFG